MKSSNFVGWILLALHYGLGSQAIAFSVDYDVSVSATVNPGGSCIEGISVVSCSRHFSSQSSPIPEANGGFRIGQMSTIRYFAQAVDGPITSGASGEASFSVLERNRLFRAYVDSSGQNVVQDCVPRGDGGSTCYSANAWAFPSTVRAHLNDGVVVSIPSSLDGQAVSAQFVLPIFANGSGSSFAQVSASVFSPVTNSNIRQTVSFGNLNVHGGGWDYVDPLVIDVPIRLAGDLSRVVFLQFGFDADFRSSTVNGPGFINSLASVGLHVVSLEGVTFRSESGYLDPLFASAVPEPSMFLLVALGLVVLAGQNYRAHLLRGRYSNCQ